MRLNVCRLCLSGEDLFWIYDKNVECEGGMDLQEIVFQTSGVKILAQDMISQKICKRCHTFVNNIWQFRTNSIKTDIYLKDELEKYLRDGKLKIPNTEMILKYNEDAKMTVLDDSHPVIHSRDSTPAFLSRGSTPDLLPRDSTPAFHAKDGVVNPNKCNPVVNPNNFTSVFHPNHQSNSDVHPNSITPVIHSDDNSSVIHPSVEQILHNYPGLNLPKEYLDMDFDPFVSIDLFHVEQLFQEQNLSLQNTITLPVKVPEFLFRIESCETVTSPLASDDDDNDNCDTTFETQESDPNHETTVGNMVIVENKESTAVLPTIMVVPASSLFVAPTIVPAKAVVPTTTFVSSKPVDPTTIVPSKTVVSTITALPKSTVVPNKEIPMETGTAPEPTEEEEEEEEEEGWDPYTCDICSFVVEDGEPENIRKHRKTHVLRCKYCRKGYVGTKILNNHIENRCHHRKALISNPVVMVKRVEKSSRLKRKYPNAFKVATSEPPSKKPSSSKPPYRSSSSLEDKTVILETPPKKSSPNKLPYRSSSTHEDRSKMKKTNKKHIKPDDSTSKDKSPSKRNKAMKHTSANRSSLSKTTNKTKHPTSSVKPNVGTKVETKNKSKEKYSSSIIKPRIGIKYNDFLNTFDSKVTDIEVTKNLITKMTGFKIALDKTVQTDPVLRPTALVRSSSEVMLKHLRLDPKGSILVNTKNGTMDVMYEYEAKPKVKKKACVSWIHLAPIDLLVPTEDRNSISLKSLLEISASTVSSQKDNSVRQSQILVGKKPSSRYSTGSSATKEMLPIDQCQDPPVVQNNIVETQTGQTSIKYVSPNGIISSRNGRDTGGVSWPGVPVPQHNNSNSSTSSTSSQQGTIRVKPIWELSY